jgi:serine/threonine protein kinase
MLTKNPEKRISASEALKHSWFKKTNSGKNLFLENKNLV